MCATGKHCYYLESQSVKHYETGYADHTIDDLRLPARLDMSCVRAVASP